MRIIVSLIILGFVLFSASADAQTRKRNKSAKTKIVKKIPKTISAGVVNGRAIDLVVPKYPKSARTMNVYGVVDVQILIDETGTVISAEAISGHPLLRPTSVKAALESKFTPMTLSGETVRVNGIIVYRFTANEWNWLEIGYAINYNSSYYTLEKLLDLFPPGHSEERQLLKQYFQENESETDFQENQIETNSLETVIVSIRAKLSNYEKSSWLFSVGLLIGKVKNNCCQNNSEMQNLAQELKILLLSKPENINSNLISTLERFILLVENPSLDTYNPNEGSQIYQVLQNVESKFPYLRR